MSDTPNTPAMKSISTPSIANNVQKDFCGWEFAIGSAVGVRGWGVDKLGRLCSLSFDYIWTPGENVCRCNSYSSYSGLSSNKHSIDKCICGFYAYHDGVMDYKTGEKYHTRVTGIIRGYGKTVIGSRGFRSEKAEIVALCVRFKDCFKVDDEFLSILPRQQTINRLHQIYGVPVYRSYRKMLRRHPVDRSLDPDIYLKNLTPETDPDFWKRKI